jgi:hypothetical protein
MVIYTYNPSTQEAEAKEDLFQFQFSLQKWKTFNQILIKKF